MAKKLVFVLVLVLSAAVLCFAEQAPATKSGAEANQPASPSMQTTKVVGTVEDIDVGAKTILVMDKTTKERKSYSFSDSTTFSLQGKKAEPSALKKGDEISMKVDGTNSAVSVNVVPRKTTETKEDKEPQE